MSSFSDAPRLPMDSAEEWRSWLSEHHDDPDPGVWIVWRRRETERPELSYEALVEEALAFGWIDGQAKGLDDDHSMLWMTRRRPGSVWSRLSKERVDRVVASGRMTPAGQAAIDRAKADGSWSHLDSVEAMEVPDDLAAALDADPEARRQFDAFTPGRRKEILRWLVDAKRAATREARIAEVVRLAAQGIAARDR
ncbi:MULTISPECIES: YdeI/OmpD-associated family protein [Mumia]|uniref:YdeI/OmpD-associated family protein n=1 Tax=Mumia TaxID=1546255 RepID=UPI001420652C|nr:MULTISPECIES: YdeI/OmpD-associated family protein [unclassified Mumia]QMW66273.1 YdeI/OmpD-associated family protein [Mumia sp. ZJ1417]